MENDPRNDWGMISMDEFIRKNERHAFSWDPPENNAPKCNLSNDNMPTTNQKHKRFNIRGGIYKPLIEREPLGHSIRAIVHKVVPPDHLYRPNIYRRPLALKVLDCKAGGRVLTLKEAREEVEIMKDVVHPHIVAYMASYEMEKITSQAFEHPVTKRFLGIVMYPPASCNLAQYLQEISDELLKIENGTSNELELWAQKRTYMLYRFFGCIAQAVSYLQDPSIRIKHKDIKPENIVIDDFGSPILTDFGIAKKYASDKSEVTEQWTAKTKQYACPEAMNETARGFRSDVFSLGCVNLEMITIILGKSLVSLHSHRCGADQSSERCYSETIKETDVWIGSLSSATNSYIDSSRLQLPDHINRASFSEKLRTEPTKVLSVIKDMMREDQNERPQAYQLWDNFKCLYLQDLCVPCEEQHSKRVQSSQQDMVPWPVAQLQPSQGSVDLATPTGEPSNVLPPNGTTTPKISLEEALTTPQQAPPKPGRESKPPRENEIIDSSCESISTQPTSSRRKKDIIYFDVGNPNGARVFVIPNDDVRMRGKFIDHLPKFHFDGISADVRPARIQTKRFSSVVSVNVDNNIFEVQPRKYGWGVFWRVFLRRDKHLYVLGTTQSELEEAKD